MKLLLRSLLLLALLCGSTITRSQGQSAALASLSGTMLNEQGEPLAGATLTALHLPTGNRRVAPADAQGQFDLRPLLVGGPYVLQIAHPGYRTQLVTNVYLKAGQPVSLHFALVPDVVAVGSRRADRTALESIAPVDVIDMRALALTAPRTDLTQLLGYVVPSFNSNRQTAAAGSDHVDPSALRGLGTDQVLVLLNGKRFHSTALINVLGNQGVGNPGTDLNLFSANALDRVEILRDGAAAQYGSDAIAGVMNLQLKSDDHGGTVLVNTGLHQAGDGLNTTLSLNKGFKLTKKGFLNLTGEADYRAYTVRNYGRDPATAPVFSLNPGREDSFLLASHRTYADYQERNADARVTNYRGLFNAGITVSERLKLYSFGTYVFRQGQSATPWELPSLPIHQDQVVAEVFPLGYQPRLNSGTHDASLVLGATLGLGAWKLDLSNGFGTNRMRYDVANTLNASLGYSRGAATPTAFVAGGYQFSQNVANATLSRLFPKALAGTNVAFGAEYRYDDYRITAGQEESYTNYRLRPAQVDVYAGSQGFIGFSPLSAVQASRQNAAGFVDVEADVTKRWAVNAAVRFEQYSDFGSAFTYKVSSRYQVARLLALRGGYNTGFKAPSLQQSNFSQLSLTPTLTDVVYGGLFSRGSDLGRAAQLPALRPESSQNLSAGLVLTPAPAFSFTADAYQIDIEERILPSGQFGRHAKTDPTGAAPAVTQAITDALNAVGVDRAQFLVNAADTRTRGLDLAANYAHSLGRGAVQLRAAANFNATTIRYVTVPEQFQRLQSDDSPASANIDLGNNFIDQRQLSLITTGAPRSKVFGHAGYSRGKVEVLSRLTRFGEVAFYDYNFDYLTEGAYYLVFAPKYVTDLIVTYHPAKAISLTLGANNLFNVLPDDKRQAARNGHLPEGIPTAANVHTPAEFDAYFQAKYGVASYLPYNRSTIPYEPVQMGLGGAFFYLKAAYSLGL